MAQPEQTKRKPTHAIYHVRGEDKNEYWTRVGAAWIHKDGEGLSLALDFVPMNDSGRLVVRANKPGDAQVTTDGGDRQ